MSIGISGKVFSKGFELYVGKGAYTRTLTLLEATIIALDKHPLLSLELAIRW